MPVQDQYQLPPSAQDLPVPNSPRAKLFIAFISSTDPVTKQPWCPDVRATLPRLQKTFEGEEAPQLLFVHVGQRAEWKEVGNVYRTKWGVKAVPQLVRFQRVDDEVRVTGELVENEVNDEKKLGKFVGA